MLLLTFTAGANRYAIDAARIVEIVPRVELRKILHAPVFLSGLLCYRGTIVPVIDLGLFLDMVSSRDLLSTRIILVNDSRGDNPSWHQHQNDSRDENRDVRANQIECRPVLGLVAEHVSDLTYVRPEQIRPAPISFSHAPYLGPIVQDEQGILQLILVEKLRKNAIESSDSGEFSGAEFTI